MSHSKVPQKSEVVSEEPKAKSVRPYTVVQKPFTAAELAFWSKSGIGERRKRAEKIEHILRFFQLAAKRRQISLKTGILRYEIHDEQS